MLASARLAREQTAAWRALWRHAWPASPPPRGSHATLPPAAPQGLSCAVSVRVSNALGAGLPRAARRSAHTAAGFTVLTQAFLAAALVLGHNHWARLFTGLDEVVSTCAAAFPIMAGELSLSLLPCRGCSAAGAGWLPPHLLARSTPLSALPACHAHVGCMFGDGFNATVGGILRGTGRQELDALLNLASYWVGGWVPRLPALLTKKRMF